MPSPPIAPVVEETTKRLLHRLRSAQDRRLAAEREAASKMLGALERLAAPHDCGCVPCVGQCRSQESLQITVDAMRDLADEAIKAARAAGIKSPLPEPQSGEHP